MGWASSADYMQGTNMAFRSREDAVAFVSHLPNEVVYLVELSWTHADDLGGEAGMELLCSNTPRAKDPT